MNPSIKFDGSLLSPRKFSSLKYDITCVVCFQKFIISCAQVSIDAPDGFSAMCSGVATWYSAEL